MYTSSDSGVTATMVHDFGGELLFGRAFDVTGWGERITKDEVEVVWWRFRGRGRPLELLRNGRAESFCDGPCVFDELSGCGP